MVVNAFPKHGSASQRISSQVIHKTFTALAGCICPLSCRARNFIQSVSEKPVTQASQGAAFCISIITPMNESLDIYSGQPQRISLDDVAKVAGVSKATVCRALRGTGRVSAETRERIQALADEMGYKPDPALSALTRYRWGNTVSGRAQYSIAMVKVDPTTSASSQSRSEGVVERASELNFILEMHTLDSKTSPSALSRMLYARGVDGIIFYISGPVFQWDFPWEKFACVTIGFDGEAHRLNSVTSDWFSAMRMVSSRARMAGGRRIGFANFYRGNPSMDDRVASATLLERAHNVKEFGAQPPPFWYPVDRNLDKNIFSTERDAFLRWFEKHKPDVVVDGNQTAYWWLKDAGVRLPQDVGYVSLNAVPSAHEHITGAVHQRRRQARLAVDLLFNLIQINERGLSDIPLRLTTACEWYEGRTLRAAKVRKPNRKRR